jgi:membrane associated rhomboid family serine protease
VRKSEEQPAWAAEAVYPAKSEEFSYGAISRRGRRRTFESFEALGEHVRGGRESVEAVWTPETDRTVPPEAVPDLLEPLRQRFVDNAAADAGDARRNTVVFSVLLLWALYSSIANRQFPTQSVEVGLAALLLVLFGLIPWYDAWKARVTAWNLNEERLAMEEQEARFERWLRKEKSVITFYLLGLMVVVGAVQIWIGLEDSVRVAGLDKARYKAGEHIRLFTSPFLHGHPLHWALNAAGLWFMGKRVEALARWPHLVMVFFTAMLVGGMTTTEFMTHRPSVGASGGLMGLLGFILVFETLHPRLVPHSTRQRLFAALLITFVVGFIGYRFIDNYAHGGGLVAGLAYGALVFPRSRSARRPEANKLDMAFGALALGLVTTSALVAVALMVAS